jgi:sRNA-binding carbon storage regulator CsrA
MLVLTIDVGDAAHFTFPDGSKHSIFVNRVGSNSARIAFDFPPDVRIVRDEIDGAEMPVRPSTAAILLHRKD